MNESVSEEAKRLESKKNIEGAIALWKKIIDQDPTCLDAYIHLAADCGGLGRFSEAEQYSRTGLKIDPNSGWAQYYLALALMSQNRLDEASREMNQAVATLEQQVKNGSASEQVRTKLLMLQHNVEQNAMTLEFMRRKHSHTKYRVEKIETSPLISQSDLPFTFVCPSGCQIQREYNISHLNDSCLMIGKRRPDFHINLIWGPHSGYEGAPPGYRVMEHRQIATPKGEIELIVARGALFSSSRVFLSSIWGIAIGIILLILLAIFLRTKIGWDDILISALGTAAIAMLIIIKAVGPTIKYAFVYDNIEYVFTGSWKQKPKTDECIASLKFLPLDNVSTQ